MKKVLDYDAANEFVEQTPGARWEGWDIVLWKPANQGWSHQRGEFVDGRWGISTRSKVTSKGTWYVNRVA